MQTRPFLPALLAAFSGAFSNKSHNDVTPSLVDATGLSDYRGISRGNSGSSNRVRQRISRPFGRKGRRNGKPIRQLITDRRFMNRCQRIRADRGEKIYV